MKLLSRTWGYMDMPCTDPSMVFMPTWDRVLQDSLEEDCRYRGPPQQDGKLLCYSCFYSRRLFSLL